MRWSRAYLIVDEARHGDGLSVRLLDMYGEDTPGASAAVARLVEGGARALLAFSGDPEVVAQSSALFEALASRRALCRAALKTGSAVERLVASFRDPSSAVAALAPEPLAVLVRFLCRAAGEAPRGDQSRAVLGALLEPAAAALGALFRPGVTPAQAVAPAARRGVQRAAKILGAVAGGCAGKSGLAVAYSALVGDRLGHLTQLLPVLASVAPEEVQHLAALFVEVLRGPASVLAGEQRRALLQRCSAGIRAIGAAASAAGSFEVRVELLRAALDVVQAAGCLPPRDAPAGEPELLGCGLEVLVPLLSADALQLPEVAAPFYGLVRQLSREHAALLLRAPAGLAPVLRVMVHGLGKYGDDATRAILDAAAALGKGYAVLAAAAGGRGEPTILGGLGGLQDAVLEMMLLQAYDAALREPGVRVEGARTRRRRPGSRSPPLRRRGLPFPSYAATPHGSGATPSGSPRAAAPTPTERGSPPPFGR